MHGQESSGSRLFSAEELPWEGTPHPPKLGAFGSQVHQQPVNEGLGAAVDTVNCCCIFLIDPCQPSKIRACLQAANLLPVKLGLINLW